MVLGHLGKSGGVYSVIKNYTNFLIKNHEVSILGARSQSMTIKMNLIKC